MRNIIAILLLSIPSFCVAQSNTLVISEVYGGGGNVNATYKSDYIQIFNLSPSPVNLDEYSIQVAEAGESKWVIINLSGVLQANHWYLLKGETGGTDGADLPLEDATGNFNLNTTGGKIALVKSNRVLNTSCLPFHENVVDFLGYGITDCAETSVAPGHTNSSTTSRFIFTSDANNNAADFTLFPPNPKNSSEKALPITLNVFSVNRSDDGNRIHWQVNYLSTSVKFELERSATLQNFTKIYAASETKARCASPFDFLDNNPQDGPNYYRLKISDIDGHTYYSKITLSINYANGPGRIKITPSLVTSFAELSYTTDKTEPIQVQVTDLQGKVVYKQSARADRGENIMNLQTGSFSKGQYHVTLFANGVKTAAAKFIKQ